MASPIPSTLTSQQVRAAVKRFNSGYPHSFSDSTKFDVIVDGQRYPPKAIVGLTVVPRLGKPLKPSDFSGGSESKCVRVLERAGFRVVDKPAPVAWIFQGRPDTWRLDDYLSDLKRITWYVGQEHFAPSMRVGQSVFIWRAAGTTRAPCGIIARCTIRARPRIRKGLAAEFGYAIGRHSKKAALAVELSVDSVFTSPDRMLHEGRISHDIVLRGLRILRMRNQTNYPLQSDQVKRIAKLLGEKIASFKSAVATDEAPDDDPKKKRRFAVTIRTGQGKFRANLLRLYNGRCAISGTDVAGALDACHLWVHSRSGINHSKNGILLRADLHRLFDKGLMGIDAKTMTVVVWPELANSDYHQYHGVKLATRTDGGGVSKKYLLRRTSA